LTGLDDPVWVRHRRDGAVDLMGWTDGGEGLLALDRNGNGTIESGAELFGNATPLLDGTRALNGYLALAELDSGFLGGNGDVFFVVAPWLKRQERGGPPRLSAKPSTPCGKPSFEPGVAFKARPLPPRRGAGVRPCGNFGIALADSIWCSPEVV
jgi:hypothetical protein